MESKPSHVTPETTQGDARAALASAETARRSVTEGLHYPPAYLRLMAFSGASLPLLLVVTSDSAPGSAVKAVLMTIGFLGVIASGWAFSLFESSNGVRISGFRSGRRLSFTYLIAMLALFIAVVVISSTTGAWWAALVASPLGAAISVAYAKAWLEHYRRTHA